MRNPLLFARVAITLALAWAAAAACVALHTPLPWMIGPLLVTSLLSIGGAPTESWAPLRNAGQWSIGASLGLYFTPQVVALVASLWWAIALGIVWALVLGWLFGVWLYRVHAPRMHGVPASMMREYVGAIGDFTAPVWPVRVLMLVGLAATLVTFVLLALADVRRAMAGRTA